MEKLKIWFLCRLAEASSRGGIAMVISGGIMVIRNLVDQAGWTLIVGGIYMFCTKGGEGKVDQKGNIIVS